WNGLRGELAPEPRVFLGKHHASAQAEARERRGYTAKPATDDEHLGGNPGRDRCVWLGHQMYSPASSRRIAPVMCRAASEQRKATTAATSSGAMRCRMAVSFRIRWR